MDNGACLSQRETQTCLKIAYNYVVLDIFSWDVHLCRQGPYFPATSINHSFIKIKSNLKIDDVEFHSVSDSIDRGPTSNSPLSASKESTVPPIYYKNESRILQILDTNHFWESDPIPEWIELSSARKTGSLISSIMQSKGTYVCPQTPFRHRCMLVTSGSEILILHRFKIRLTIHICIGIVTRILDLSRIPKSRNAGQHT